MYVATHMRTHIHPQKPRNILFYNFFRLKSQFSNFIRYFSFVLLNVVHCWILSDSSKSKSIENNKYTHTWVAHCSSTYWMLNYNSFSYVKCFRRNVQFFNMQLNVYVRIEWFWSFVIALTIKNELREERRFFFCSAFIYTLTAFTNFGVEFS